ncbi:MAG: YhcH/YjgK/YiaL family protein [Sphaerochaetaceae bacterium]|jgi:YhcH/YjgK/YiaL family protein|nr:YhcH/YjgK/YiaL family protein [Sphaerochaetaceae bacterium]
MIFDILDNLELYQASVPKIQKVTEAFDKDYLFDKPAGHYKTDDPDVEFDIEEAALKSGDADFEFHKKHLEIYVVLQGSELLSTAFSELRSLSDNYDEKKDVSYFKASPSSVFHGTPSAFCLFFPGEPHKAGIKSDDEKVKRAVFRIKE